MLGERSHGKIGCLTVLLKVKGRVPLPQTPDDCPMRVRYWLIWRSPFQLPFHPLPVARSLTERYVEPRSCRKVFVTWKIAHNGARKSSRCDLRLRGSRCPTAAGAELPRVISWMCRDCTLLYSYRRGPDVVSTHFSSLFAPVLSCEIWKDFLPAQTRWADCSCGGNRPCSNPQYQMCRSVAGWLKRCSGGG